MQKPVQRIEIETSTIVRTLLLVAAFGLGWLLLVRVERQLIWLGVAFFLAVALDPAVSRIAKWLHSGRLLAASIVSIIFALIVAFLAVSLVPPLVNQSEALVRELPQYLHHVEHSQGLVGELVQRYHVVDRLRQTQNKFLDDITSSTGTTLGIVRGFFNGLTALLAIFVLTFFMLLEGPRWVHWGSRQLPAGEQPHYSYLLGKMYRVVAGYVTGNLIIAVGMAILVSVLASVVGVQYAIPLGILSGLLTIVPLIGGLLGMILVCSVAAFTSWLALVALAIYFVAYMAVDSYVLRPVVYSRTVAISPLLVMIAIVLGASLYGIIGALVAIPVMGCVGVLVSDWLGLDNQPAKPRPRVS